MHILWLLVPILLVLALFGYIYKTVRRSLIYFTKIKRSRQVAAAITVALVLPIIFARYVWLMVLLYFAVFSALIDFVRFIIRKIGKREFPRLKKVYYTRAVAVLFTVATIIWGYVNMHNIVETDYAVSANKALRSEGYSIAFASDLHFGTTMDADGLRETAARIEATAPDMLILGGDIVDESTTAEQMRDAFSILGGIDTEFGAYFVYGNHDRQTYSSSPEYTEEELEQAITAAGITILCDEGDLINDELVLVGREDRSNAARAASAELMLPEYENREVILIDHQPYEYGDIQAAGYDMVLSGHTHAGQIWPLGILAEALHFEDMYYGIAQHGQLTAIVTSGLAGWGFALRTEKHSEFVVIKLG